jgi:tRNA (cytidine/uridine-2'-O-)-methyltransferase
MVEIALYQPDIAPNVGTIARLCACFGLPLTIIEPAGFAWNDSRFRRAGMDYIDLVDIRRASSWQHFRAATAEKRLVLLTTKAETNYLDFKFRRDDVLLFGSESAGVPAPLHASIADRIVIPVQTQTRSLNVAIACAIVASEALRQIR